MIEPQSYYDFTLNYLVDKRYKYMNARNKANSDEVIKFYDKLILALDCLILEVKYDIKRGDVKRFE